LSELGDPTPYPTGLFDLLKPRISPKLVRYIAESDAGEINYKAQRDAINKIIESDRIPLPLESEPAEAFSMIMWSVPGHNPDAKHLGLREQHVARMFCCACLLAAYPARQRHESEPSLVLPPLIESTIAAEPGWLGVLRDLIEWARDYCDQADPSYSEHFTDATHCRMSLVIIDAASNNLPDPPMFVRSVEEIFDRKRHSFAADSDGWSWLLEGSYFDSGVPIWKSLAKKYLLHPPADWPDHASDASKRLGEAMIRDGTDPTH